MLNTDKLKLNIKIWKDIKDFPLYNELYELSKAYYNNSLRFLFCDKDKFFLVIKFRFINNQVEIQANYFFSNKELNKNNIDYENYIYHLDKNEFDNKIQELLKEYYFNDGEYSFIKYAFLPVPMGSQSLGHN